MALKRYGKPLLSVRLDKEICHFYKSLAIEQSATTAEIVRNILSDFALKNQKAPNAN